MERFDVFVIGAGSAGEAAVATARERGASVAIADRDLFGGSCPFWACIPSKSLLHGADVQARCGDYPWQRASDRRDYMIVREGRDYPDDSSHVRELESQGARVLRGAARLAGPHAVEVEHDGSVERFEAGAVILAVGSQPSVPSIPGLADASPWTNRDATSTRTLPRSLVVLGGGATGVELASVFARYGVPTTLVHSHDRLLNRDFPRISDAAARVLREDGVELRLGQRARAVAPAGDAGHRIELSDGSAVTAERILVALGRSFPLDGLGLESIGVDAKSLRHDGELRIADGVFLAGDPAGPELFTHVSWYQGGLAARMALGDDVRPNYSAIPRAVYTDPELASVGMHVDQAREAGVDAFELVQDFTRTARGEELEAAFGHLEIVVDRGSGVLVGASIVAPDASAAIHELVLAVRARVPVAILADTMHAFPSTPRALQGLFPEALKRVESARAGTPSA